MNKKQVVYLNLFQFRFPITAIVSILHRVSGVLLVLFIPAILWALQQSLASDATFNRLIASFNCLPVLIIFWLFLSALFYHLAAGIRHLFMDCLIGDSKMGGKIGAYLVMILSAIFMLLAGWVILW